MYNGILKVGQKYIDINDDVFVLMEFTPNYDQLYIVNYLDGRYPIQQESESIKNLIKDVYKESDHRKNNSMNEVYISIYDDGFSNVEILYAGSNEKIALSSFHRCQFYNHEIDANISIQEWKKNELLFIYNAKIHENGFEWAINSLYRLKTNGIAPYKDGELLIMPIISGDEKILRVINSYFAKRFLSCATIEKTLINAGISKESTIDYFINNFPVSFMKKRYGFGKVSQKLLSDILHYYGFKWL